MKHHGSEIDLLKQVRHVETGGYSGCCLVREIRKQVQCRPLEAEVLPCRGAICAGRALGYQASPLSERVEGIGGGGIGLLPKQQCDSGEGQLSSVSMETI